jgi:hypothetical protein
MPHKALANSWIFECCCQSVPTLELEGSGKLATGLPLLAPVTSIFVDMIIVFRISRLPSRNFFSSQIVLIFFALYFHAHCYAQTRAYRGSCTTAVLSPSCAPRLPRNPRKTTVSPYHSTSNLLSVVHTGILSSQQNFGFL